MQPFIVLLAAVLFSWIELCTHRWHVGSVKTYRKIVNGYCVGVGLCYSWFHIGHKYLKKPFTAAIFPPTIHFAVNSLQFPSAVTKNLSLSQHLTPEKHNFHCSLVDLMQVNLPTIVCYRKGGVCLFWIQYDIVKASMSQNGCVQAGERKLTKMGTWLKNAALFAEQK